MENIDVSVTCDALYDININTPTSTPVTSPIKTPIITPVTNNHCINKFFQWFCCVKI